MLRLKLILVILAAVSAPLAAVFITQNPFIATFAGFLGFTIATFAVFLFLKPLGNLIQSAQALASGNMNARVDIRSKDELESIGASFNILAEKLSQIIQRLESDKDLLSAEKTRLDIVLASIIDGIIALDHSLNIVFVNQAAEYLISYTQQEIQGKPVDQFVHLFNEQEQLKPKTYCQKGYNKSLFLIDKNGKRRKVNIMSMASAGSTQTNLGCVLIIRDISREEELEQMKFDFVSMASHELKTPITAIIGYLSVFINENKSKVEKQELELLDRVLVSAQSLLTLVENLLSVNKIEREQLSVSIVPADYKSILLKTIDDIQNQAKLKNITLTLVSPRPSQPKVLVDPIRIIEVINNLVSNAIKYTQSGGRVDVGLEFTPTEVITTISDTGIGIPKEAIPQLFNKFFRVSNIQQQVSKGTGLGLFITKSIIEKLNGKIWVDSEENKGSKFHFSLPLVPQTQVPVSTDRVVSETIKAGALNY